MDIEKLADNLFGEDEVDREMEFHTTLFHALFDNTKSGKLSRVRPTIDKLTIAQLKGLHEAIILIEHMDDYGNVYSALGETPHLSIPEMDNTYFNRFYWSGLATAKKKKFI